MNSSPTAAERLNANYILDSSAALALILAEPGGNRTRQVLADGAAISAVNLAEVVARLVDAGFSDEEIGHSINSLGVAVVAFSGVTAVSSGLLRRMTRSAGLSVGDRACLGLAKELDLPVVTADRVWASLDLGIEIELIR